MNDNLYDTLNGLLQSGSDSNPALNRLLSDYTTYHMVLVLLGGFFLAAFVAFTVFSWTRFRRAPRIGGRRWTFEKKTYFWFGTFSTVIGLMMAGIVAANASSVADPRQGLAGSIGMLDTPQAGSRADSLHQTFNTWLQSGDAPTPLPIQAEIDDRLAWQQPKAVVCSVLLIVIVWLSVRIWRTLIEKSRLRATGRTMKERGLLATGGVSVIGSLLLMLMVIGNTQASFAPLGLTLFFG